MTLDYPITLTWQALMSVLTYDATHPLLFSSGLFLWGFAGFILVYAILRRWCTPRLLFVVLFSYAFYYKSSGVYVGLLALITCSDYLLASLMGRTTHRHYRRLLLGCSLSLNLGLLCYFKYTNFFLEAFTPLWQGLFEPLDIFLPVGISFFTFQSLSYTKDVYRGRIVPLDNLLDYAFYVSFFPQLVAGPIVRASDFLPQIRRPLVVSQAMIGRGLFLIACGLVKKAIVSDYISVNFVERVFDTPQLYSGVENLLAVYGYALQIYCDFSGYSDMAIGLALLLGFHFPDNFRAPYMATSITDFWRRWHISLSSWLRDYVYIPLGGNRCARWRQHFNLLLTMLLGGLWHGASLNFVLWGGLHGVALVVDKVRVRLMGGGAKGSLWRVFGWVLTFHFVCLCWLLFRHEHMDGASAMLHQIVSAFHPEVLPKLLGSYPTVFVLMALGYVAHFLPQCYARLMVREWQLLPWWQQAFLMIFVIYLVVQFQNVEIQPFIYFQF